MKGPGYMALLAGKVHIIKCIPAKVHIIKCIPEIKIAQTIEYYEQFPVLRSIQIFLNSTNVYITMSRNSNYLQFFYAMYLLENVCINLYLDQSKFAINYNETFL